MNEEQLAISRLFGQAIQKYQEGKISEAKADFYQILGIDSNNFVVLKNLGLLCAGDEALNLLRKALTIKPDDQEIRSHMFSLLISKKNGTFGYAENCIKDYPWISNNKVSCGDEIFNLVLALPFPGIFASDNLVTWGRNLSFLGDTALMSAINNIGDDIKMAQGLVWRSAVVVWAARNGLRRDGDFVECGTYKGTTAKILLEATGMRKTNKKLWLYDAFQWSEGDKHTPLAGLLDSDLYAKVSKIFSDEPNVNIVQGYIPDSFKQGMPEKISFLHIDMNNAYGEVEALKVLWDKLVPGGILVLDDYGWECLSKQKLEEDKFFKALGYEVLELPTGQGIVLK